MKILDLGCGENKIEVNGAEIIGLDRRKTKGVDVVWDLEKTPLPFKTSEFDMVHASHCLEHIQNFFPLMEELYRILKPNGILKVYVPFSLSKVAVGMADHKRGFCSISFSYFYGCGDNVDTKASFSPRKIMFNFIDHRVKRFSFLNHIFNPVSNFWQGFTERFFPSMIDEIYFELVKKER